MLFGTQALFSVARVTQLTHLTFCFQVRTVVEMLLWKRYYLSGMMDSEMMLHAVRFSLCADKSEEMLSLSSSIMEAIFDADVKASCFPGSYANMWHMYAVASILEFKICSVYPMFNHKIRPYFNRVIHPRAWPITADLPTLNIMWSGHLKSKAFRPDNFVALVNPLALESHSSGQVSPVQKMKKKRKALQKNDLELSYTNLKKKYRITKRTYYRWKKKTWEYCNKSTARYEAKYFMQACFMKGQLIPLHEFMENFPEISRSSYYNWKHELLRSGGNKTSSSGAETSSGDSTEQEACSSPEEPDRHSVPRSLGQSLDNLFLERAHGVASMQEAKRCLQNSIALKISLPFRIFKRSFPGISRSTYYNWRREALEFCGGSQGATQSSAGSIVEKSQSPSLSQFPGPSSASRPALRERIKRSRHRSFMLAYLSKKHLRDTAKVHIRRAKWSLIKFKVKYPTMSCCFYWLWQRRRSRKKMVQQDATSCPNEAVKEAPAVPAAVTVSDGVEKKMAVMMNGHCVTPQAPKYPMASFDAPYPRYIMHAPVPVHERMLGMDVVAMANMKAEAKLFLQRRFEQKAFPTFREFRLYFPFTPRSTYYMWKRALYHGVSLIQG